MPIIEEILANRCRWTRYSDGATVVLKWNGSLFSRLGIDRKYQLIKNNVTPEEAAGYVSTLPGKWKSYDFSGEGKLHQFRKPRYRIRKNDISHTTLEPIDQIEVDEKIRYHQERVTREMIARGINIRERQQINPRKKKKKSKIPAITPRDRLKKIMRALGNGVGYAQLLNHLRDTKITVTREEYEDIAAELSQEELDSENNGQD